MPHPLPVATAVRCRTCADTGLVRTPTGIAAVGARVAAIRWCRCEAGRSSRARIGARTRPAF